MAIERKYTSPKRVGTGQNKDAFAFKGCVLVFLCIEVAGAGIFLCGAKYTLSFDCIYVLIKSKIEIDYLLGINSN
ncbi:hypothetical protein [Roseibium sp.]|uniref:hypothetical protein n=1 Tax=Roseibium sp. TaxID=1936156 RepID=UPI003B509732